ncbi:unnamed protein product [Lymnaea stagnalis]|uniref:Uncharacterized protein n=1 Tax=Lymnaea stagnalis TaxID=6523 RepID=A0AAV2I4D9_LYMST
MNTEEDSSMQAETIEPVKESAGSSGANENFVVLDMAGDSEDSDKDDKTTKETKDKTQKVSGSDNGGKATATDSATKPGTSNTRLRKKPKAPVVDVNSLRKRKWQLKVYPLHAEDLQLNYMSILCKLASESLLYIPSEGRHGKAELYVATQKETAAIIGKLLRMEFHHKLLSIEVVRKDTGGKEDGDESKKECKAFLMFDKFLSKKIFDAKGEKGMLIEKIVTLNKLPKAATKDFIGALFPFATEIEIIESDNPDERKATVRCKTPVTSLLVYKSFKRLEINDVHVKLSVDDSVKAISLPPMFFIPRPEKKDTGPPDSMESLNQSSLPRRPMMTPLNRRIQQIKKRALLTRKKPTRGQLMRGQRPNQGIDDHMVDGPRGLGGRRSMPRRGGDGRFGLDTIKNQGPGSRDYPGGPGRRRMNERQNDRRNRDRDSRERSARRSEREESQVTKEMLQLQNQLNQAIKNQIAMLSTAQTGGGHIRADSFPLPGSSHRTSLLGHGPRYGAGAEVGAISGARGLDQHPPDFGGGSWSADRGGRDRNERVERIARPGAERMDRPNRPERVVDRKRMDLPNRIDNRSDRIERDSRDRADRSDRNSTGADLTRQPPRAQRQVQAFGGGGPTAGDTGRTKERSNLNTAHGTDAARGSSRGRRGPEYPGSTRVSQRNEGAYSAGAHAQGGGSGRYGDYAGQVEGDNSTYYRRY